MRLLDVGHRNVMAEQGSMIEPSNPHESSCTVSLDNQWSWN